MLGVLLQLEQLPAFPAGQVVPRQEEKQEHVRSRHVKNDGLAHVSKRLEMSFSTVAWSHCGRQSATHDRRCFHPFFVEFV